jgi:hypothetical protein
MVLLEGAIMDNWQAIKEFYSKNGLFLCAKRGRGKGSCEIAVKNVLFRPASSSRIRQLEQTVSKTLPPSYRQFLSLSNGGIFFTQKTKAYGWKTPFFKVLLSLARPLEARRFEYESGWQLYSVAEAPIGHKEVLSWLKQDLEEGLYTDESKPEEKAQLLQWLDNIVVIGEELNSGNYLAIDFNRKPRNGEYPVIFMDHEVPLSYTDVEDDEPVIARAVDELLLKAAENPAAFLMDSLGGAATYTDGQTEYQWYPETYQKVDRGRSDVKWDPARKKEIEEKNPTLTPEALLRRNVNMFGCLILRDGTVGFDTIDSTYAHELVDKYLAALLQEIDERSSASTNITATTKSRLYRVSELLKDSDIDYVKLYALLDSTVSGTTMPGGCKAWACLSSLRSSLKESIIEHMLDADTLAERVQQEKAAME